MKNLDNPRHHFLEQAELMKGFFGGSPKDADQDAYVHETVQEAMGRHEAITAIYEEFDKTGFGLTLTNSHGDSWAVLFPDASEPGRFRYQTFRACGWTSHYTMDTADECILDAFDCGFRVLADNQTLDRLASTPEWAKGIEQLNVITLQNTGRITPLEAHKQLTEIAERYSHAA